MWYIDNIYATNVFSYHDKNIILHRENREEGSEEEWIYNTENTETSEDSEKVRFKN